MNTVTKKTRQTPPLSPGEYVATVTNVTIKQLDKDKYNVFWTLEVDGVEHPRLNSVRKTDATKKQMKDDAKIFGLQINVPQDLTKSAFSPAIGKRVKIEVKKSDYDPDYPKIYFKKLLENKKSLSTWNC